MYASPADLTTVNNLIRIHNVLPVLVPFQNLILLRPWPIWYRLSFSFLNVLMRRIERTIQRWWSIQVPLLIAAGFPWHSAMKVINKSSPVVSVVSSSDNFLFSFSYFTPGWYGIGYLFHFSVYLTYENVYCAKSHPIGRPLSYWREHYHVVHMRRAALILKRVVPSWCYTLTLW